MNKQEEQHPQQLDAVNAGLVGVDGETQVESVVDVKLPAGLVLSTARKAQEQTVEELARQLNLSVSTIRALETDQAEGLPELTYVRGYIRSYARLLGLDPEVVLSSYSSDFGGDGRVNFDDIPHGLSDRDFQVSARRSIWLKWSLICGAVILLLYWWAPMSIQDWFADNARERPVLADPTAARAENNPIVRDMAQTNSTAERLASGAATGNTGGAPINTAESQPTLSGETSLITPESTLGEADNLAANESANVADAADPSALTVESGAVGDNILVLSFASACWVDARDSQNNRLAYQTVVGGEELQLVSSSGMTVFLGNAEGVTATLNGQPFDLTQFRQGVYAKFTIDATPDAAQ